MAPSSLGADIWAAGIVLFIFVTSKVPFFSESATDLFQMIAEKEIDFTNHKEFDFSAELIDILSNVLEKDPIKRSSIGDLLTHNFVTNAKKNRDEQHGEEIKFSHRNIFEIADVDATKAFSPMVTSRKVLRNVGEAIFDAVKRGRKHN